MSEWKKKKSEPENEEHSRWFCSFEKRRGLTVGEEPDDEDDDEEWTMRRRSSTRGECLEPHSVAPAPTGGSSTPPNFDLRHSDPGGWISPPPRLGATFSQQQPPC